MIMKSKIYSDNKIIFCQKYTNRKNRVNLDILNKVKLLLSF